VLILNFQGASASDLIVVTYQQIGDQLVRTNQSSGVTTTVARHVTKFLVGPSAENPAYAQIEITVAFRYFSSTYTLIGISPT
jgi:hypothetical protein